MIERARQLCAKEDNICKSGKSKRATMGAPAAAAMMSDQVWHHLDDTRPDVDMYFILTEVFMRKAI